MESRQNVLSPWSNVDRTKKKIVTKSQHYWVRFSWERTDIFFIKGNFGNQEDT